MIDIHNHILINVDDGPKTKEDLLRLLEQAKKEGLTGIIVTPHHLHPSWNNTYQSVEMKVNQLLQDDHIKKFNIEIFVGQEVRIKDQIFKDLEHGDIKGLNNSKYILIELPTSEVPSATKKILYELQIRGLIPIIAHPERNKIIANNIEILYDFVNNGALSQLTSASLNGDLGKKLQKTSIEMIKNNLVHFIASDAHDADTRPFLMNQLLENRNLEHISRDIKELFSNGEKVISNKSIVKHPPIKPQKQKRFLGLF